MLTNSQLSNLQLYLKLTAKQCHRCKVTCEKEERQERNKVKKAIERGNIDCARIYAQNSIRKRSEAVNYLRLSSRIDAVASRVDSAVKMQTVTRSMVMITKGMESVLKNMHYEKINSVMTQFEQQFQDLDVTGEFIDSAIAQTTSTITPEDEVTNLMSEIADEHGLEIAHTLAHNAPLAPIPKKQLEEISEKTLEERLAALRIK